jgi:hypothetical protein
LISHFIVGLIALVPFNPLRFAASSERIKIPPPEAASLFLNVEGDR